MSALDRPEVKRVQDAHGSHIEPALDQAWPEYQKLLWHAAVIEIDSGLRLDVRPTPERPGKFAVFPRPGWGSQYWQYNEAWAHMNDLARGAEALLAQQAHDREQILAAGHPGHKPVQHRDGKPPWCNTCGLTAALTTPTSTIGRTT